MYHIILGRQEIPVESQSNLSQQTNVDGWTWMLLPRNRLSTLMNSRKSSPKKKQGRKVDLYVSSKE